jgi:UTP--glucose-1-phosphate uridylyltransferase
VSKVESDIMNSVDDAIILAGGRGTRMLPASLYIPKEAMALVDTPIINHLIWEAARAGVKRIHLVFSKWKRDLFSGFISGEHHIPNDTRIDLPREALRMGLEGIDLRIHVQESPGGVANAISCALPEIEGPFIVLLGDNLLMSDHKPPQRSGIENASNASLNLVKRYLETGLPTVGACRVSKDELSKYGVVQFDGDAIKDIIEKPPTESAPSEYVLCGRYLFPASFSKVLNLYPLSKFGEDQSIKILHHYMNNNNLGVVVYHDYSLFDSGDPISWLKSQIVHALKREDLSESFVKWLRESLFEI